MPRPRGILIWPAAFTCLAATILAWLGVWQLQRLAWKEGLIAAIETRASAAPQSLPPVAEWLKLRPENYEYRRVGCGIFEHGQETLVFSRLGWRGEPGARLPCADAVAA